MISSDERSGQMLWSWKTERTPLHVKVTGASGVLTFSGFGTLSDFDEEKISLVAGMAGSGLWDLTLRFTSEEARAAFALSPDTTDGVVMIESESGLFKCALYRRKSRF